MKRLVYDIKDSFFQKDEDFLKNIGMISVTFDNNNAKLKENNFCYEYRKILNPEYHFREEKYIIYTTIFQINKLASSELIFIDATLCSKKFLPDTKLIIFSSKALTLQNRNNQKNMVKK